MNIKLTPRQERFAAEYLVDLNATQAAIRAGYSPKTAQEQSSRLLSKAIVAKAVAAGKATQLEKAGVTAQRVLQEIARIAFSDVGDFFDRNGNLKPISELSPENCAQIASLEVIKKKAEAGDGQTDRVHKFKLWDKLKALELAAKHLGLLTEQVRHEGEITFRWETQERPNDIRESIRIGDGSRVN